MIDLIDYIKDLEKKGYSIQTIKSSLLRYGYPEQVIDQALYNLNNAEVKSGIHLTKTSLTAIAAILLIGLIIGSFLIFGPEKIPGQLLDISIDSLDQEAAPGDILSATFHLANMGSQQRYDVYLKYEIFKEDSMERLAWKSETLALESTKTQPVSLSIPANAEEGNYILQITARYKAESASAHSSFQIMKETAAGTCFDNIRNQAEEDIDCGGQCQPCRKCPLSCDDNDPITIDYCSSSTNFLCRHDTPAVCGDNICSGTESTNSCPDDCMTIMPHAENIWSKLEEIKVLAGTNIEKAKQECEKIGMTYKDKCLQNIGEASNDPNICAKIEDQMYKERCFSNIAQAINKPALCENIEKESRRDSCYVNFAVNGDYSVCEKVANPYLKKSCNNLKQVSA